jgi:hypothetical protein
MVCLNEVAKGILKKERKERLDSIYYNTTMEYFSSNTIGRKIDRRRSESSF